MAQVPLTDQQCRETMEAVEKYGDSCKASRALGVPDSTFSHRVRTAKMRGIGTTAQMLEVKQGWSPEHGLNHIIPQPLIIKGTSTLYGANGEVKIQWVKSSISEEKYRDLLKVATEAFMEDLPKITVQDAPVNYDTDIIPWIQIGDAHLGLLAHHSEIGENFDLKIAERELITAIDMLLESLPSCERMVINDLGDFTHYQNFQGVTDSGHPLDLDTRFPHMIRVYSRVMRAIVEKVLAKARFVDVIVNQGNHSRTNDIWMAELLKVAFGHTGRVHILNNDDVFIPYRMGNTLVMTHHSDKCKPKMLSGVMTEDFRKDYGETTYHYIDIGHVHHGMVMKEYPSIFIESFNHLASLDRWAHDSGYRNRKSITVILRSKTYGEVGRILLPIEAIQDRLLKMGKGTKKLAKEVYSV